MSLEQKIMTELKAAMLAKDEKSIRGLRAIKAAILLAKTSEGSRGELKDDDEIKLGAATLSFGISIVLEETKKRYTV